MKIGIMSDTHGSLLYFEKALNVLSDCDVLLHGGDVLYHGPRNDIPEGYNPKKFIETLNKLENIVIVKGNCDADVDQMVIEHPIQSPYVMSQFGEIRIILNHGYIESEEEIIDKAKKMGGDILVLGHTHVKKLYMDDNLIVINPGSTSIPKDGSHSVAIIDIIKTDDEDELRTVESELPFVLESINVDGNLVRGTDISCVISDGALVCTIDYNMRLAIQEEKEKMNDLYVKGKVK